MQMSVVGVRKWGIGNPDSTRPGGEGVAALHRLSRDISMHLLAHAGEGEAVM